MEIIACFKHIEPLSRDRVREHLANLSEQHFDKHLASLGTNPVLHATVEREAHHRSYRVRLRLALGSKNLVVRDQDFDLISALDSAAESLEWRVRRFLGRRRARRIFDKRSQPNHLPEFEKAVSLTCTVAQSRFADLVEPRLMVLTGLVQRELAFLQAEDRLGQDYPTISDILDDVLVRALELAPDPKSLDSVMSWLNGLTVDVLADYVVEYRIRQSENATMDGSGSSALDREPVDDTWLDEALGLPELEVPVVRESDAIAIGRKDAQRQAIVSLRGLPTRWRRAVWFRYVDELPIPEIAAALRMSTDDVEEAIDASILFLRERLSEQGMESFNDDWPAEYLVAPPTLPDTKQIVEELERLVRTEQDVA